MHGETVKLCVFSIFVCSTTLSNLYGIERGSERRIRWLVGGGDKKTRNIRIM